MLEAQRDNSPATLVDVIDRILDKGLIINADICVSIAGIELLGISLRAAVASFETAAKYGLNFPSGTDFEKPAWEEALVEKETCPQCGKTVPLEELLNESCPWCGWVSAKANSRQMLNNGSRP
jgi:ssDNA-binding Zn-finger/Zn-ribbon topoisomerase 1